MSSHPAPYRDRQHAGQVLAQLLLHHRGEHGLLVLALPRGGVAVGCEVARALRAPLDIFVVRKLGMPGHEEYAIGAIASGGVCVMNSVAHELVNPADLEAVMAKERRELQRREHLYRGDRAAQPLRDRFVIVVDDGLATGSTMRAALLAIRQHHPRYLTVAVPVGPHTLCEGLKGVADEVICAATPDPFHAVGLWYHDFPQASDDEVRALLATADRQWGQDRTKEGP